MAQGVILKNEWLTRDWLVENVKVEGDTSTLVIPDEAGFKGIVDRAFNGFTGETVILPKGLIYIGKGAFEGLRNLKRVVLPAELECIDERAFHGCESLVEIKLPYGLRQIKKQAFYECASLEEIIIPGTVLEIGSYAFYRCKMLSKLKIKRGVRTIGMRAFGECLSLSNFHRRNMPNTVNLHWMVVNGIRLPDVWNQIFCGSPCAKSSWERMRRARSAKKNNDLMMSIMVR